MNASSHNVNQDAATMEEATSFMLYLSKNTARPPTLPLDHVGHTSQDHANANHPNISGTESSSAMEVDATSSENRAQHSKYANFNHATTSSLSQGASQKATGNGYNPEAVVAAPKSAFPEHTHLCDTPSIMAVSPPSSYSIPQQFHHHHSTEDVDHERRGLGYLLLAADVMERTESREIAIRRAAL